LHRVIGRLHIRGFIESLVMLHVVREDLAQAYRQMAKDETREAEALGWAETTVVDAADERG
jgi:hypothetical protein